MPPRSRHDDTATQVHGNPALRVAPPFLPSSTFPIHPQTADQAAQLQEHAYADYWQFL